MVLLSTEASPLFVTAEGPKKVLGSTFSPQSEVVGLGNGVIV